MPELIPVLDLLGGEVVRGIAGERAKYRANRSCLVDGADPVRTALAFRELFELNKLYVADLDALQGGNFAEEILRELTQLDLQLTVDAGVTSSAAAETLFALGIQEVVLALESLPDLSVVDNLVQTFGSERFRFSLDLKQGNLLGVSGQGREALEVVQAVTEAGITTLIVLDLAAVGTGNGLPTLKLCQEIRRACPEVNIWTGGGIRDFDDFAAVPAKLIDGLLIASALHDGAITPVEWSRVKS